ncbi:MAG: hypothetical protein CMO61_12080 [Verrucomicrobiales bacterium]|jgi:hypothetical protein|nr:hypothetical protein [Verrucomicrobiales bacterium]
MEVILGKVSFNSSSFRGFGLATKFRMSSEEGREPTLKLVAHSTDFHCVSKSAVRSGSELFVEGGKAIF